MPERLRFVVFISIAAPNTFVQRISVFGAGRFNNLRLIIVAERLGFACFDVVAAAAGSYLFADAFAPRRHNRFPLAVTVPESFRFVVSISIAAPNTFVQRISFFRAGGKNCF